MHHDIVRDYLRAIGKYPLLTQEEEQELGKVIAHSCDRPSVLKAKQKLYLHNLKLVVSIAKRFQRRGMELIDLIQDGNVGLKRAIEKFDYSRNCKFSTYAYNWIWQACVRALQDKEFTIRLPNHLQTSRNKVGKAYHYLSVRGKRISAQAIAHQSSLTIDTVKLVLDSVHKANTISLNTKSDKETGAEYLDFVPAPQQPDDTELRDAVWKVVGELAEGDRTFLIQYFGLTDGAPKSCAQIARDTGVKREVIRAIKKRVVNQIKSEYPHLKDLLEG